LYGGIALVAISVLGIQKRGDLSDAAIDAPVLVVVRDFEPHWLSEVLAYVVSASAMLTLIITAIWAMLGLSRLGYSLATNRQIPTWLGRLHRRYGSPYILIAIAAVITAVLVLPLDLGFLIGAFAYGAMLTFTIAHISVCRLRYREPQLRRLYKVPLSINVGKGELPLPALLGALIAAAMWGSILIWHHRAALIGTAWMILGIGTYLMYRLINDIPVLRRVTIPESVLQGELDQLELRSVLVPIFGTELDDDIIQTAGRLASEDHERDEPSAVIEALWIFKIPMSLPIDGGLNENELKEARKALARAKAVGEEYEGVEVATATVRARRVGEAIVSEARRRGVEAIILAAESKSPIRGGVRLGGGGVRQNVVGEGTKYVLRHASCRVVLTAPAGSPVSNTS